MSDHPLPTPTDDAVPGSDQDGFGAGLLSYAVGFALALGLTATSFWVAQTDLLWGPGIAVGLCVLAIAQMGVHLVFFLHIGTGPDQTNNILALAFGILIIAGSLWIMANLDLNMMPVGHSMNGRP